MTRGLIPVLLAVVVLFLAANGAAAHAQGDANAQLCTNEASPGFRSYLPDCRAYEMVTPLFKAGDFVAADGATLSEDGNSILGESLANFAEEAAKVVGQPLHPYLLERTAGGWTATALLSPAQAEGLQRPGETIEQILFRHRDQSTGQILWTVLYGAADGEVQPVFYVEQAGGSFTELGPATPGAVARDSSSTSVGPAEYAVSPDISHVVFPIVDSGLTSGEHWPGDTTKVGAESLYEYTSGDGGEPKLVGVRNSGRLNSNTEAELISSCGTALGAGFGEKRYALPNGGDTVIFTASAGEGSECSGPPVEEIYARIHGERTVDISEPSHEVFSECNIVSGLQSATYQGATADGSKVFFITAQELLPGAAGENLYLYDFDAPAGQRLSLVSSGAPEAGVQGVLRLSQDGSHVYFVATGLLSGENAEHKVPVQGADNLYLFERDSRHPGGRIALVATLAPGDEQDWEAGDLTRPVAITPSGEDLLFASSADLASGDVSTQRQLFEYDAGEQELARISIGQHSAEYPRGYGENGNATSEIDQASIAAPFYAHYSDAAGETSFTMSNQGNVVFFQTPLGLTPQASDNVRTGRACVLGVETEVGECRFGEHSLYAQNVYEYRWSERVGDGMTYT